MLVSTGPPSLRSKLFHIILIGGIITLFFQTRRMYDHRVYDDRAITVDTSGDGVSAEEQYVGRLAEECGLSNETAWLAWRVEHSEQIASWASFTEVALNFEAHTPRIIDIAAPNRKDVVAKKKMELPVHTSPRPGQVEASDLILGVSTTFARVSADDFAMVTAWGRWLTNGKRDSNGASLIVMLDQATDSQVGQVDRRLQASGIDAYVTTTEEPMSMARRYYELARILKTFGANLAANGQEKRWFGLVEDDIFFPSLSYLMDRLLNYNSDGKVYFGLPSERDDWEMEGDSITTFGGGAIFLSRSAITEIPRLPCFGRDASGAPIKSKHWDVLLQDCIAKHLKLDMHVLPGFFSPRDPSYTPDVNSYETGLQPLLLHHAQDRHTLDINKAHLVTDVCGEACFMQRHIFHDNWILVNGVSITEYPDGLQYEDPAKLSAEAFGGLATPKRIIIDEPDTTQSILNWRGRKNVWKLMDSAMGKNGAIWQAYIKRPTEPEGMDSVIVMIWEKSDRKRTP